MPDFLVVFFAVVLGALPLLRFIARVKEKDYSGDRKEYEALVAGVIKL